MRESGNVKTQNGDYCDLFSLDRIMKSWISELEGISGDSLEQSPTFRQVSLSSVHRGGKEAQKGYVICLRSIANRWWRRH